MNSFPTGKFVVPLLIVVASGAAIMWLWRREQALQTYEREVLAELVSTRRAAAVLQVKRGASSVGPYSVAAAQKMTTDGKLPATRPTAVNTGAQLQKILRQLPEYDAYQHADWQRQTMRYYGEWFSQLAVPAERLALIKQWIADEFSARRDGFNAMVEAGYDSAGREGQERLKRVNDDSLARLKQELTPDEYLSYQNFDKAKNWVDCLPEIDAYFAERSVPSLTLEERRAFTAACVEAIKWEPEDPTLAPGVKYRLQNEHLGTLAAQSLNPAQREALSSYISFFNERTKRKGELFHPENPEAVAYSSGRSF
jgi:hypothetical protein